MFGGGGCHFWKKKFTRQIKKFRQKKKNTEIPWVLEPLLGLAEANKNPKLKKKNPLKLRRSQQTLIGVQEKKDEWTLCGLLWMRFISFCLLRFNGSHSHPRALLAWNSQFRFCFRSIDRSCLFLIDCFLASVDWFLCLLILPIQCTTFPLLPIFRSSILLLHWGFFFELLPLLFWFFFLFSFEVVFFCRWDRDSRSY